MGRRYAQGTTVSSGRSREQIEVLLRRYGATEFAYMTSQEQAFVGFVINGHRVQIGIPLPNREDFNWTNTGRHRKKQVVEQAWENECRRRWRVLKEMILVKLEAVECQVSTIEKEFLAFMALPDGMTVGERFIPELQKLLEGKVHSLLPSPSSRG